MATTLKPGNNSNNNANNNSGGNAPQPKPAMNTITGTFTGLKPPAVNGIAVLTDSGVQSFTVAAAQGQPSAALPSSLGTPIHLVGDLTNGVAVADNKSIFYLTGVGVTGAVWNTLPTPNGMTNIVAMCGDLANGLVITDGTNIYAWLFSGAGANEWTLLAALPTPPGQMVVSDMAGDPTNGVLLALSGTSGPSSLYFGGSGCSCAWVPVTSSGTSLPVARVQLQTVCGSYANGFVLFGENQMFTLTGLKYTASTSSAAGSCTASMAKIGNIPPFAITDLTGDPTNGLTARGGDSGLIANSLTPYAAWTLINAVAPTSSASSSGQSAGSGAPAPAPAPAPASAEPVAQTA